MTTTAHGLDELKALAGTDLGHTGWLEITQERVNTFADATNDHQWIHVDRERAAAGPFGTTIAHGFLTLSLLSNMAYQVCPTIEGVKFPLNYGFNRLRFVAPVPVNSRVRAHFVLKDVEALDDTQRQIVYEVSVEIEGRPKPALVAEWLTRIIV